MSRRDLFGSLSSSFNASKNNLYKSHRSIRINANHRVQTIDKPIAVTTCEANFVLQGIIEFKTTFTTYKHYTTDKMGDGFNPDEPEHAKYCEVIQIGIEDTTAEETIFYTPERG